MTRLILLLLTLLFSLSGPAMREYSDFGLSSFAAKLAPGVKYIGKLGAARGGSELMVHPFSGGGTHITTSTRLAAHAESATFGGPSGLFVAPTRQVDALLASGATRTQIEIALGLNQGSLSQGALMRIDVANPFTLNLSLPTSGNMFFRPGTGMTWGGLNEGVITSQLKTDPGALLRPIP